MPFGGADTVNIWRSTPDHCDEGDPRVSKRIRRPSFQEGASASRLRPPKGYIKIKDLRTKINDQSVVDAVDELKKTG